jgi:hypothetical protein
MSMSPPTSPRAQRNLGSAIVNGAADRPMSALNPVVRDSVMTDRSAEALRAPSASPPHSPSRSPPPQQSQVVQPSAQRPTGVTSTASVASGVNARTLPDTRAQRPAQPQQPVCDVLVVVCERVCYSNVQCKH